MAKGAYIGVLNEYYPAFADNTWTQIIKACQKNEVPSTWAVGDSKTMTINGTDYPIDIIGIKHDTYADGSGTAPLTFQMHDIYASSYAMNSSNTNSGGWESTAIRTTRLPAILALMPSEVQAGIKEVNKITGQGGSSFALETTADKLFILSVNEIFGYEPSDVAKGEGSQYAYYANGNSTQKKQNGEYNYWWTRSPVANNSSGFFQVRTDGSRVSTNYPSGTYGVAFAFCFGGTSEVNTEFPSLGTVARKVKKGYIGVDGLARKIKKAYIGIGGVARPCWSGGELAYYGTITSLSEARWQLAATTVGKYALFAGGQNNVGHTGVVDAYNTSLVRSTPTALQNGEPNIHATSVGKYAVFGAYYASYAYDESLTSTTLNPSNRIIENYGSATTVGDYALFAVGQRGTQLTAVSSSLTISRATALSNGRSHLSATAVGNYALFAGGDRTQYTSRAPISVVDAYDSSLTRTLPSQLSVGRGGLSATAVGNYALFGGGDISTTTTTQENTTAVDVYDTSLSRTTTSLSAATRDFAATTVGNYALFGGGINPTTGVVVSAFDQNLTRTTPTGLSGYRDYLAATAVGDYALFGGGRASQLSAVVDAYTI